MTISEYDSAELRKLIQQTVFSVLLLSFLHYKYEYIQPLILQSILPLKNLYSTPLFKIFILGRNAETEKELKRPWVAGGSGAAANPFAAAKAAVEGGGNATTANNSANSGQKDKKKKKDE